jgi:hypothetical protein
MSWGLDLEVFRGSPMYGLSCLFHYLLRILH